MALNILYKLTVLLTLTDIKQNFKWKVFSLKKSKYSALLLSSLALVACSSPKVPENNTQTTTAVETTTAQQSTTQAETTVSQTTKFGELDSSKFTVPKEFALVGTNSYKNSENEELIFQEVSISKNLAQAGSRFYEADESLFENVSNGADEAHNHSLLQSLGIDVKAGEYFIMDEDVLGDLDDVNPKIRDSFMIEAHSPSKDGEIITKSVIFTDDVNKDKTYVVTLKGLKEFKTLDTDKVLFDVLASWK